MEGNRLNLFLDHRLPSSVTTEAEGCPAPRAKAASKAKSKPPDRNCGPQILVPEDQLFVHTSAHSSVNVDALRYAFQEVWRNIPSQDRYTILDYWRTVSPIFWLREHDRPFRPEGGYPYIRLMDDPGCLRSVARCDQFGLALHFQASWTRRANSRYLPCAIACLLARVLPYATGQSFRWDLELIETPYERWEKEQGGDVSEEACDLKWRELWKECLRHVRSARRGLLKTWRPSVGS